MQVVGAVRVDQPFVVRARYGTQAVVLGGVMLLVVVGSVALVALTLALDLPVAPAVAVLACAADIVAALRSYSGGAARSTNVPHQVAARRGR